MTVFIETPSPPRQEEKPKDEPMETEPEPEPEVDLSMKQVTKHCVLIILPAYPHPTTRRLCEIRVGWVGGWFSFLTTLDLKKDEVLKLLHDCVCKGTLGGCRKSIPLNPDEFGKYPIPRALKGSLSRPRISQLSLVIRNVVDL